jgi:hypothetical protein
VNIHEPPLNQLIAAFFVVAGVCAAVRGGRRLWRGLTAATPLDLVRGIRDWILALVASACTTWILTAEVGYLILGLIVLGEELYETGLLVLVIRLGDVHPAGLATPVDRMDAAPSQRTKRPADPAAYTHEI